jgi:hypothetical protein
MLRNLKTPTGCCGTVRRSGKLQQVEAHRHGNPQSRHSHLARTNDEEKEEGSFCSLQSSNTESEIIMIDKDNH